MRRQLKAAQKETEKLQAAGDAYKRELLQQKLSDTEWGLAREQDRAKEAESDRAGASCFPLPASRLLVACVWPPAASATALLSVPLPQCCTGSKAGNTWRPPC